MIATPFVTFKVARSWIYAEAPTSTLDMIVGHCLARCIGNSILNVLFVQFVLHLCRRFAASAGGLLDYGKTFLIWLALTVVLLCMFAIGSMVLNQGIAGGVHLVHCRHHSPVLQCKHTQQVEEVVLLTFPL